MTDFFPGALILPLEICQAKESNGQQGLLIETRAKFETELPSLFYDHLHLISINRPKQTLKCVREVTSEVFDFWAEM